ncbi:MAG: hypothetical protein R6X06_09050 [Gammaproteobacteria bacterium]
MKARHLPSLARRCCSGLALLLLCLPLAAQERLDELLALKENHAFQLVLQLLDEQQPDPSQDIEGWMAWERERLVLYEQTRDWPRLIARSNAFPGNLSSEFLLWARTLRARALLAHQQPHEARRVLQALIWLSPSLSEAQNRQWLALWRRQVIETYLEAGLMQDAYTAEQRYQQDYGQQGEQDRLRWARILLLNNHVEEAAALLSQHTKDPEAGMLYLVTQLRGGEREAKKVLQAALRQLRGKWVDERLKHRLWAVVAEAARHSGDRFAAVNALEHLVALVEPGTLPGGLFTHMDADGLWQAYIEAAQQLGNQQGLLIGDDENWLKYARHVETTDHLKGRALYAFLLLKGQQNNIVEQAAVLYMQRAKKLAAHETLIKALFLQSDSVPAVTDIPLPVRHALVDIALRQSDIPLASQLMATMDSPPQGVDQFMWQLRRARILVMGGKIEPGRALLLKLLHEHQKLPREALDRYLQVVFDLQRLQAHDAAVELLAQVSQYYPEQKLQRELYFWMAESRQAQGNYTEAARWYLKSAILPDVRAMDPWAQAARYQAAASLAKAGLLDDARKMYEELLRVTEDKNRVAVLQRELQQLRHTVQ